MTGPVRDTAGAELNKYWKSQQPKPTAGPKQPEAAPIPRPQTTPAECQECPFRKTECLAPMRLWSKRAPRPELSRAWAAFIQKNAGEMPCLVVTP